jgi:hypothetical protein
LTHQRQQHGARREPAADHDRAVERAGDHAAAAGDHSVDRGPRDIGCLGEEDLGQRHLRVAGLRAHSELRVGEAGAQAGDAHAGAAQLRVDGLRERLHERLAGGVGREAGHRLERGGRGHVQYRARAALDQRADEGAREVVQGLHVEPHDVLLALEVRVEQRGDRAEAGVVAEPDDRPLTLLEPADQRTPLVRIDQVAGLDARMDAVRLELTGERAQPLDAAGDEHDVVAAPRELARELRADAGRRSGDHDGVLGRSRR